MILIDNDIKKLLDIATAPTGLVVGESSNIPEELVNFLSIRNGFFAFESALEVFPLGVSSKSYPLVEWNDYIFWRAAYKELAPKGVCFAQDVFGCQFVLHNGVHSFDPETGDTTYIASSINEWCNKILNDFNIMTGYTLAHEWQKINGPLLERHRLVPIIPFTLGGEFAPENLVAMDALQGMRLRGDLANQLENLPDGASVQYQVTK